MIRTEADHASNQSDAEVLGRCTGGFALSEDACSCAECDTDLDHGDPVTAWFVWTVSSIHHGWSRKRLFCVECAPSDLDGLAEMGYGPRRVGALVKGTLRDRGYYGHYADGDGGWEKEWTHQDGKWAEFAATRLLDRRDNDEVSPTVTDVGDRQFNYSPVAHGGAVAVPATVLARLIETSTLEDTADTSYRAANDNPIRWATALLDDAP